MIELGKIHSVEIIEKNSSGFILRSKDDYEQTNILLPKKEIYNGHKLDQGDIINVFIFKDSDEKIMATLKKPKLSLGETAVLKVIDITNFGAFLDWGLDKDLLLPLKEQVCRVKKGHAYLVGLFLNNNNKLCATMKIYDFLSTNAPCKKNDRVQGTVYNINEDLGVFVAVDNQYHGLILNKELYHDLAIGDRVDVRIKKVRHDGKLELSLRQQAYHEIEHDAQMILDRLKAQNGKLPLNDSSSPEDIKDEFNMSKAVFKRAVGRLMKEGAVKTTESGIEMIW